jgi:phosphoglycolate phosphatase
MIKLIIFDYDGVIVDSFSTVHEIYRIAAEKLNKACPEDINEFRKVYAHSSRECYSNLGYSEEEKVRANLIFKEEVLKKEPKPFENIFEVIKTLHKDYKLAVVSSNYKAEIEQKLEKLGVLETFDFVLAREDDNIERFEKTESIKKIINDLAIKSDEALLIGDRMIDFVEGSKAGLKNILLVDYGWGYDIAEIPEYKQEVLVKSPKDILEAVKRF